ncbi:hypothetical protein MTBGP_06960 [Moorella thermoacetica]
MLTAAISVVDLNFPIEQEIRAKMKNSSER